MEKNIDEPIKSPASDKFYDAVDDRSEEDEKAIIDQLNEILDLPADSKKDSEISESPASLDGEKNSKSKIEHAEKTEQEALEDELLKDDYGELEDSILSESLLEDEIAAEAAELLESVTTKEDGCSSSSKVDEDASKNTEKIDKIENPKDPDPDTTKVVSDDTITECENREIVENKSNAELEDVEMKDCEAEPSEETKKSAEKETTMPSEEKEIEDSVKTADSKMDHDGAAEEKGTEAKEENETTNEDRDTSEIPLSENANLDEEDLLECEAPKPRQPSDEIEEESKDECEETSSSCADEPQQEDVQKENIENEKDIEDIPDLGDDQETKESRSSCVTPDVELKVEAMQVDNNEEVELNDPEKKSFVKQEKINLEDQEKSEIKDILAQLPVPSKLSFLRKFATSSGKIARDELEELLTAKLIEVFLFSSENAKLRGRVEKQEILLESMKSRVDNLKKQYDDLEMIHNRVMKDLKERSNLAVTPVKITRAVGLQVYQPSGAPRLQNIVAQNSSAIPQKRKIATSDALEKATAALSTDLNDPKRKKLSKVTPMRPPLSDSQNRSIESMNALEAQKLKADISRRMITPSVSLTARKSTSSIDLTREEASSSNTVMKKIAVVQKITSNYQTPALVAMNQMANRSIMFKPQQQSQQFISTTNRSLNTPPQMLNPPQPSKPGFKKLPNRPVVQITKDLSKRGIVVSWNIENYDTNMSGEIKNYEIYAYEDGNATPSVSNWRKVGDVKALLLPMAVTLTQFNEGQRYFFTVRAIDEYKRYSHFSFPRTWE